MYLLMSITRIYSSSNNYNDNFFFFFDYNYEIDRKYLLVIFFIFWLSNCKRYIMVSDHVHYSLVE